jgi:hypothetical protein
VAKRVYKIYYMNNYKTSRMSRDLALDWVEIQVRTGGGSREDYEIVDEIVEGW